jgi:hypothetical protein
MWILTNANLTGHVISCLISYLRKHGASNWDVGIHGKRFITQLQERKRAQERINARPRPAHADGLEATLSDLQSTC